MLPYRMSFVDLETTGANALWHRIIEIGIVQIQNNKIIKKFNTLVNPQSSHLDPFITTLTGITMEDLEKAPTFDAIKNEIFLLLKNSFFVAHNVRFDYGFLRNEFKRYNIHFSARHFCTIKLARMLYPGQTSYNLDSIINQFHIVCKKRHRAFYDAMVLWEFIQKAQKDLGEEKITTAIFKLLKKPTIPIAIEQKILDELPESPGVYIFYGENNTPLYIGKSIDIKERIFSHFSNDHQSHTDMKISQQIKYIETIKTAGELGALLLESSLIKKKQPLFNKKLRFSHKLIVLKRYKTGDGYLAIKYDVISTIDAYELEDIVGICKSIKQAKNLLYTLARDYMLCPKLLGIEKTKHTCFYFQLSRCRGACMGIERICAIIFVLRKHFISIKLKHGISMGQLLFMRKVKKRNIFLLINGVYLVT
jgi:DNA polymerase-3 subunit epsilon